MNVQNENVGDVVTVVEYKFQRRDVLRLGLGGVAAGSLGVSGAASARADDAPPPAAPAAPPAAPAPDLSSIGGPGVMLAPPVAFAPGSVTDMARALAKKPFKAVTADLPDPFKTLTFEQYSAIHARPEARVWSTETVGFALEPLHRGFIYGYPIELNLVSQGQAYRLVYDPKLFDLGALHPGAKTGDIGFSGFRVFVPHTKVDFAEIANFQGANFFRALTGGQVPGLVSRALAVRLADPKGEDVPSFRTMWIEKPSLVTNALIVHAVIDSETITGAFRFTIHPGEATIIDTECTLFARVAVDNIGLGTMSATHLLGFMDHRKFDDLRPNVSEVCGLQMLTGAGEWLWRPVANRDTLQISTFIDEKPKGFGFLLRDRNFDDYADEDQHWERRPSLWIEPLGEWGQGGVQLIEIPSESEGNNNILCFWRPKQPLAAGSETPFAYRQFWCWDPPERPQLARAITSRSGRGSGKRRRFFVDFSGDILADAARTIDVKPTLTASSGTITSVRAFPTDDKKSIRIFFELDPGSDLSSELRLLLEAQGKAVSETWLYRWTPA
ncbi:glucan biosynthesis protein [Beijerinckia sp. L45]|uniref:glucan biosynthesis protein n=1 Tax=Beijerinckia sp. L45 TaxID=1641855 RepID=UPI00210F3771|nr:glucan biosynthesis protein D [Beijerinckia sp. L45]